MSHKALKSAKSRKREKRVPQSRQQTTFRGLVFGLATLLGGFAAAVTFLPRVSVAIPSAAVDPNNVMSCSFEISNIGYVPLEDVSVKLAAAYISGTASDGPLPERLKSDGSPNFGIVINLRDSVHHYVGLDDRFTVNPENNLIGVKTADVAFVVSYSPWIIPMRREKMFRFIAKKDARGHTYWRSWPVNEPAPTD